MALMDGKQTLGGAGVRTMELQIGANLLIVDAAQARVTCESCKRKHLKCDRRVPTCSQCRDRGVACCQSKAVRDRLGASKLKNVSQELIARRAVPLTWAQVVETCSQSPARRFYLRRYIMPLVLLLPKPTVAAEILQLGARLAHPRHPAESRVLLQIQYSAYQLDATREHAIAAFFRMFNPFYPLFSEEGFRAKPRSPTLHRLVIQVGLERMPQSDLTRAAMQANGLTPEVLHKLPPSLDTVQCLLLVLFGVRLSTLEAAHFRIFCSLHRLIPLLGLHATLPSNWLERTLAMHMASLGSYNLTIGQYLRWTHVTWLKASSLHLNPRFLPEMTNRQHFPHPSDRIHFILSQTI